MMPDLNIVIKMAKRKAAKKKSTKKSTASHDAAVANRAKSAARKCINKGLGKGCKSSSEVRKLVSRCTKSSKRAPTSGGKAAPKKRKAAKKTSGKKAKPKLAKGQTRKSGKKGCYSTKTGSKVKCRPLKGKKK